MLKSVAFILDTTCGRVLIAGNPDEIYVEYNKLVENQLLVTLEEYKSTYKELVSDNLCSVEEVPNYASFRNQWMCYRLINITVEESLVKKIIEDPSSLLVFIKSED